MRKYLLTSAVFAAPKDDGSETPADKAKREAAEKQAQEDAAKADAEAAEIAAKNKELNDAAEKEAERIMASDEGSNAPSWRGNFKSAEQGESARQASGHLYAIACEYPQSTPDTHTVFGFGGKLFKLGDLRALFGMRRSG